MKTEEIAREQWRTFCDGFSRQHQGGSVTLEEIDNNSGAHVITWDLALEGIVADMKHTNRETVAIVVSENTDRHVTHLIPAPLQIQLQQTEAGAAGDVLYIKSANGITTLLRFGFKQKLPDAMLHALIAARVTGNYQPKEVMYGQV